MVKKINHEVFLEAVSLKSHGYVDVYVEEPSGSIKEKNIIESNDTIHTNINRRECDDILDIHQTIENNKTENAVTEKNEQIKTNAKKIMNIINTEDSFEHEYDGIIRHINKNKCTNEPLKIDTFYDRLTLEERINIESGNELVELLDTFSMAIKLKSNGELKW